MSTLSTLLALPKLYGVEVGASSGLLKDARQAGVSEKAWRALAQEEMDRHGNPSATAFKLVVVGYAMMVAFPLMALITFFTEGATDYARNLGIAAVVIACIGRLVFVPWGKRERLRAALAGAVLRARVSGMTDDEISILKDSQELRGCSSTARFLDQFKRGAQVQSAAG